MKRNAYGKYLKFAIAVAAATLTGYVAQAQAAPSHMLTAIYGIGSGIRPTPNPSIATLSVQAKYVTWAYAGISGGRDWITAYESAGIKTLVYVALWRNYPAHLAWYDDIAPRGPNANAEAKDCSGAPVTADSTYVNDPRNATYSLRHANFVAHSVSHEFTALFLDNGAVVGGLGSLPCNYLYNGNFIPATNTIDSQITNTAGRVALMFINTIAGFWVDNDGTSGWVDSTKLSAPSNVLGLMCEQCYLRHNLGSSNGKIGGSVWANIENAEISMVQKHKIFWSYANSTCAPANSALALDQRMFELGSLLLTYDPSYVMMQECFTTTPSNLLIMPETQFVPTLPTATATSSVTTYRLGGTNLYARQYQACYYKAVRVGTCAVVVNSSSTTYTIPSTIYNAYLTRAVLVGSGVLDGGTVSFTGAKVPSIGAYGAEILIHR